MALVLACLALGLQLWALYAPQQPGAPALLAGLPLDKFVHFGLFFLPVLLFQLAGFRARWVAAAFLTHAVVSEVVQGLFLPHRSGDPWDALTDGCAVALGVLAARLLRPRTGGTRRDPDPAR